MQQDDYSWIRGVNYVPSYACTDVDIWRDFDVELIDRELGFAERLELNSVRIFLQYHVYEMHRREFLKNVETFVGLCDKHRIRPMLIVFDGCFGVAPSMSSTTWWVASPGGPRTHPDFYPEGEQYCRDLVSLFKGDPRLLMWDAMNEPEAATFYYGPDTAYAFARHFAEYLKEIDDTHSVTVGMAHAEDNVHVADVVDAVSFHPYQPNREGLKKCLEQARQEAKGKPVIASETGMAFWGSPYDLVLPFFREENTGSYFYQLMIGSDAFKTTGGIFYPDGTVRRLRDVEAVLGRKPEGFVKKPDREGIAMGPMPGADVLHAGQLDRMLATPIDDENAWERYTFLWGIANPFAISEEDAKEIMPTIAELRGLMHAGKKEEAYPRIQALLAEAKNFHWSTRPLFNWWITECDDPEGPE